MLSIVTKYCNSSNIVYSKGVQKTIFIMSKTIIELPNFEGFDYSWIDSEFDVLAQNESEYYADELNLSDEKKEEIKDDFFSQIFEELKEEICNV